MRLRQQVLDATATPHVDEMKITGPTPEVMEQALRDSDSTTRDQEQESILTRQQSSSNEEHSRNSHSRKGKRHTNGAGKRTERDNAALQKITQFTNQLITHIVSNVAASEPWQKSSTAWKQDTCPKTVHHGEKRAVKHI